MSFLIEFSWEPDWTPSPTRTLVFLLQMFWHWFFFYLQEKTRKVWILMYFQFLPNHSIQFSCSVVSDSSRPHGLQHAGLPCPSPNSQSLLKLMPIDLVMPFNHLKLCHPLLLPPSVFPSIRAFSSESALQIRWPKYWNFSFNISTSNEYSGLISFRIEWLDLLVVQGTHKSLLQHHNPKASILLHSAFFIVQLSHLYMTTGKTIAPGKWLFYVFA